MGFVFDTIAVSKYEPMIKNETTSRLSYRLEKLSRKERDALMNELSISKTTYYRLRAKPKGLTLEQAERMRTFLEGLDNEEYDMFSLLEPVSI